MKKSSNARHIGKYYLNFKILAFYCYKFDMITLSIGHCYGF